MMDPCTQEFDAWLTKYGRSRCDRLMRAHLRRRLDVAGERPPRVRVPLSARREMYAVQNGKCGICGGDMEGKNLRALDVDHKDPALTGDAFNHRSNLKLTHPHCNRSKGAKSIPEQAKHYGKTMTVLLGDEP